MFRQINLKLKTVATIMFFLLVILSIALAIVSFTTAGNGTYASREDRQAAETIGIFAGLGYLVIGSFVSYGISCLIYGFGELIEKTCVIADCNMTANGSHPPQAATDPKREMVERLWQKGLITREEYSRLSAQNVKKENE